MIRVQTDNRVEYIYDTMMGAQAQGKDIKKYVKALRKSLGEADPDAGNADEYVRMLRKQ